LSKKTKITYNTNAHLGQLKRQGSYHLTDTKPGRVEHVFSNKPKVTNSHGKKILQDDSKIVRLLKNAKAHEKNKTDKTGEKRQRIKQMLTHFCPSGEFPLHHNGKVYTCKLGGRYGLQVKKSSS
jgi:hypothetical protein